MAARPVPRAIRTIPNFAMSAPWSSPLSAEDEEGLGISAFLSTGVENERLLASVLGDFPLQYQNSLAAARA